MTYLSVEVGTIVKANGTPVVARNGYGMDGAIVIAKRAFAGTIETQSAESQNGANAAVGHHHDALGIR